MVIKITKNVLIAHQSAIPHYRVPFYNTLEKRRPADWRFDVVSDTSEESNQRFYEDAFPAEEFEFPVVEVRSRQVQVQGKQITYQPFWLKAAGYDLIIVEHALNNLTYPLCQIQQLGETKVAYWGHGRDLSVTEPSPMKLLLEWIKKILAQSADGYFAYTPGVREYLIQQGLSPEKLFTVNNTIDIREQRKAYQQLKAMRDDFRKERRLENQTVLLFVGRFTPLKRIDFLLHAMDHLNEMREDIHLLLVGDGPAVARYRRRSNVSFLGPILDLDKLAPAYIASDLFVYPGAVGLAPLQALCYDLPVLWIEADNHKPEVEYLTEENSLMLEGDIDPEGYARAVLALSQDQKRMNSLRDGIWETINHLTVDAMASRFIDGINSILGD
jgi:glycosyltransferase involved in cell wall biosynthesis